MPTRATIATALLGLLAAASAPADEAALPGAICTLTGHTGALYSIDFTPDGRQVVTGSFDRTIRLWDATSGKEVRAYHGPSGHQNYVLSVRVSPDGRRAASGGSDATARLWDLPAAAEPRLFAHPVTVNSIGLSPDGQRLATAGSDGRVRVWDALECRRLLELPGFDGPATSVAFANHGKFVVAVGADRTVRLWDAADGSPVSTYLGHAAPITSVAADPDTATGVVLYTAGEDGVVKYWQLPTPPRLLPPVEDAILALAVAADGRTAFAAGADRSVRVITLADGRTVRTLTGPTAAVRTVAVSAGGTTLAGGASDGTLWVWDPTTGRVLLNTKAHDGQTTAVALHPGTAQILTAGADGQLKLWGPPTPGKPTEASAKTVIAAHAGGVAAASFGATAAQAVTAGADGAVKVWDLAAKKELRTLGTFPAPATALTAGRSAGLVAAAAGGEVRVWRNSDGKLERTLKHESEVTSLAFDIAGSLLIAGTSAGATHLWDLRSGLELQAFPGRGATRAVAAMPTSALLLRAGDDKQITVLQPSAVRAIPVSSKPLRSLALVPRDRRLVVAGDDGVVRVLNAATGSPGPTFAGDPESVRSVAASHDGRLVAAAGEKQIRLWTLADGKAAGAIPAPRARALAFPTTADVLASGGDDRTATVWQIGTMPAKVAQTFTVPGTVACLRYSSDGVTLFEAGTDSAVRAWRPSSDEPTSLAHPNLVDAVAFQPTGGRLATGGHDGTLRLWSAAGRLEKAIPAHGTAAIHAVTWFGDGRRIVTGGADRVAKLWDTESASIVREFSGHAGPVYAVAIRPDGNTVATGGADRAVKLWRVADGTVTRTLLRANGDAAHPGAVYGARFTPDGTRLVTAGSAPGGRGFLAVWDVGAGKLLYGEGLPIGPVFGLAVSPDGRRLALACGPRGRGGPTLGYVIATPGPK